VPISDFVVFLPLLRLGGPLHAMAEQHASALPAGMMAPMQRRDSAELLGAPPPFDESVLDAAADLPPPPGLAASAAVDLGLPPPIPDLGIPDVLDDLEGAISAAASADADADSGAGAGAAAALAREEKELNALLETLTRQEAQLKQAEADLAREEKAIEARIAEANTVWVIPNHPYESTGRHNAHQEVDLSFQPGQRFRFIVDRDQGWLLVEDPQTGQRGVVPGAYCRQERGGGSGGGAVAVPVVASPSPPSSAAAGGGGDGDEYMPFSAVKPMRGSIPPPAASGPAKDVYMPFQAAGSSSQSGGGLGPQRGMRGGGNSAPKLAGGSKAQPKVLPKAQPGRAKIGALAARVGKMPMAKPGIGIARGLPKGSGMPKGLPKGGSFSPTSATAAASANGNMEKRKSLPGSSLAGLLGRAGAVPKFGPGGPLRAGKRGVGAGVGGGMHVMARGGGGGKAGVGGAGVGPKRGGIPKRSPGFKPGIGGTPKAAAGGGQQGSSGGGNFMDPAWFKGSISRQEAEKTLSAKNAQCFLLRESSQKGQYALSRYHLPQKQFMHLLIAPVTATQYQLQGCTDKNVYGSIPDLINNTSELKAFTAVGRL
jgi:SH2 domain